MFVTAVTTVAGSNRGVAWFLASIGEQRPLSYETPTEWTASTRRFHERRSRQRDWCEPGVTRSRSSMWSPRPTLRSMAARRALYSMRSRGRDNQLHGEHSMSSIETRSSMPDNFFDPVNIPRSIAFSSATGGASHSEGRTVIFADYEGIRQSRASPS